MGNYAFFKKNKANGNLPVAIIDFLSTRPTSGSQMATYADTRPDTRGTEYLLPKVNFPAKSAI